MWVILPLMQMEGKGWPLRGVRDNFKEDILFMILRFLGVFTLTSLVLLTGTPHAQADPPKIVKDHGAILWQQELLEMATDKRLMCVAAHPDDEDSETLAFYNRGCGVRTSIMLANWGEGGQNEIGSELYEKLGVIRSRETLEAADVLGTHVYSLNQIDFGFSKSIEETWEFWDREEALERAVRVLRIERPHVVITNHRIGRGHGNHQAMAQLIEEAIPLAASSEHVLEGLQPWKVERLFQRRRHHEGEDAEDYDVQVPVGLVDDVRGYSYQEIAGEALLRHRSQGAKGIWQWINARRDQSPFTYFYLIVGDPPLGPFEDLFDGMEGCWWTKEGRKPFSHEGLVQSDPSNRDKRRMALDKAFQALTPDWKEVEMALAEALVAIRAMPAEIDHPSNWIDGATGDIDFSTREIEGYQTRVIDRMQSLGEEEKQIQRLFSEIWGMDAELTFSENSPYPGQEIDVEIRVSNRGSEPIRVSQYRLEIPKGWESVPRSLEIGEIAPLGTARAAFWVRVATDESFTLPETEELYRDFTPWKPNVRGVAYLEKGEIDGLSEAEGRLEISPAWELWTSPDETLIPTSKSDEVTVTVETRRHEDLDSESPLTVTLPDGTKKKTVVESERARRSSTAVKWPIGKDTDPGEYYLTAQLESGGRIYESTSKLILSDVVVPETLKVGVVLSYDTTLPQALEMLGVSYSLLSENDVRSGDLSGFDTILIDIRAYLERQDLLESNNRFLNYCIQGGNLVVFYHKTFEWNDQEPPLAPLPLLLSRDRITDENSPVSIMAESHPLVTFPNKIGPSDWERWVQERGLYFPGEYDARYDEILSIQDPGEEPLKSGILAAQVGEGTYVYTSLVFYRELKALVPGAYRLFANLISYGQEKK